MKKMKIEDWKLDSELRCKLFRLSSDVFGCNSKFQSRWRVQSSNESSSVLFKPITDQWKGLEMNIFELSDTMIHRL